MKTYFASLSIVTTLVLASLIACTGSSTDNGSSTENNGTAPGGGCEQAGAKICQGACACPSAAGKCQVATKTDAGLTATLDFDTEQQLPRLYVTFGCAGGGSTDVDYGSCNTALSASAACLPGADGYLLPEVCKSKQR